ncbi:MAG: histidine kinase [Anaerolineaceae bacterium]
MKPTKGVWNSIWDGILVLLALVVPVLVGYDIYLQWRTPTMDFYLDNPGSSTVQGTTPGGEAAADGLEAGDVILTVDDIPFELWYDPQIGSTHVLKVLRRGELLSLSIPAVRLIQLNVLSLACAVLTALLFWGIGGLLLLRRFWNPEIRLFYLLSGAIAIAILFPLSFPDPWSPPDRLLSLSIAAFCLSGPLFLHYAVTFPDKLGNPQGRFGGLAVLYSLALVCVQGWQAGNRLWQQIGMLYFSLLVAAAVTVLLFSYQYRASSAERRRYRIIFFGAFLAILLPVLLHLLPETLNSPYRIPEWVAGLLFVIAPVSYLYATIQDKLFGIDRLINRTLVYAIMSLGIFIAYLVPYLFLYQFLPEDLFFQLAIIFSLTLWVGVTFNWLRNRAQRVVDRLFYGGWYDFPAVIEICSDALARSTTREQIMDVLSNQIPKMMRLSKSSLRFDDQKSKSLASPPLDARFQYKFQTEIPAQWAIGKHPDGDDLSGEDHRILHTLAQQAEIALNNAFAVERLQHQLDEIRASREELTQTQRQLLRSREEERLRLARDLHDSPIQSLVGLNIQLGLLLNENELDAPYKDSLTEMRAEIRRLSTELRQVCADLRPPMLDTLGLSAALLALVSEWSEQTRVETHLDLCTDAELRFLPGDAAVNLYRVAQEALVNVAKHALASKVNISLTRNEKRITMVIEDNGNGFEVPDIQHGLTATSHFGLVGMRERVSLIGGVWSLDSAPGKGTTVRVTWTDGGEKP